VKSRSMADLNQAKKIPRRAHLVCIAKVAGIPMWPGAGRVGGSQRARNGLLNPGRIVYLEPQLKQTTATSAQMIEHHLGQSILPKSLKLPSPAGPAGTWPISPFARG
jgi:hypothetical protein